MKLRPSLVTLAVFSLAAAACSDDTARPDAGDATTADVPDVAPDADPDAVDPDVVDPDATAPPDTTSAPDTEDATVGPDGDVQAPAWPWPAEAINVPADPGWKASVVFPDEPFLASSPIYEPPQPRWVKFLVFTGDPTRVFFQDSQAYPFHYEFATALLPQFDGMTHAAFDAATLGDGPGKKAILGAVLYAPGRVFRGADQRREIGVQIVGHDPYTYAVAETVLALVRAHVTVGDDLPAPDFFYMPTYEQRATALADAGRFAAAGFPLASPDRWQYGNSCYAEGWALGRLVKVAAEDIGAAYAGGTLRYDDILLTDGVPAEVPYVAGIISTVASTPSSHVAILASTFGVPFVHVANEALLAELEAMVGSTVALRAQSSWSASAIGACDVSVIDLEDRLSQEDRAAILALKAPGELDFPPKATLGEDARETVGLTGDDIAHFGGKASHFGLLRRAIPDASPSPAWAFSFDLWDRVIAPVRPQIDLLLADHAWPPDIGALADDLASVRSLVRGLSLAPADRAAIVAALEDFDPLVKIRFRSSTNVEDQASFTGAGLYDSYSGCLADDTDDDASGPSRCDPTEDEERGVFRAIRRVYASFWNDNAYLERLRHGVDEDTVGMAVLVHPSYPDPIELANGVATVAAGAGQSVSMTLVTQLGAVSVTNPEGGAAGPQPEVMDGGVHSFGTFFDVRQYSSLVPLGGYVMTYDADYLALAGLLVEVADAWADEVATSGSAFMLDLEYKKVRATDVLPDRLEIKQVRPLPLPSTRLDRVPFLLPEGPITLCTFQGEHGAILGNHRLKARVRVEHVAAFLTRDVLSDSLYTDVRVERAAGVDADGDPTTFSGFTHTAPTTDEWGNPGPSADGWTQGAGAGLTTWALETTAPWLVSESDSPLIALRDATLVLNVTYATAQPEPDAWPDGTTLLDTTTLTACPEGVVITPAYAHQVRDVSVGDLSVDVRFWWPPAPTGIVAGYTAPLAKWDVTTITGLTSSPIALRGYWSQTYRPGHHNFGEHFVLEPRLEEGVDPSVIAELEALDVAALIVRVGFEDGAIQIIGLDGKIRDLK